MVDLVHVQIVFGPEDVDHVVGGLIPSLVDSTSRPVVVWACCYVPSGRLLPETIGPATIRECPVEGDSPRGFAENHNHLFRCRGSRSDFVIVNPDCSVGPGSIDRLLERKSSEGSHVAIVEGRQWPFEHPKEYDPVSGETPWASGAFALIDGEFYDDCGGMDESYFMYLEDVDLSWRAWLSGRRVLYEPAAVVTHFSGGPFYRHDLVSTEEYFGLRNFLRIVYKFFGEKGEKRAIEMMREADKYGEFSVALDDYLSSIKPQFGFEPLNVRHPMVKFEGINRFHELRDLSADL